jgi:hypothetical protein
VLLFFGQASASRAESALTDDGPGQEASRTTPRIVNGVATGEFPTVGLLLCSRACSATLIGCNTILTAAHCVCDTTGSDCQPGGSQLEDAANCVVFFQHAPVFFEVSSIAVHPDYAFGETSDLAVLRLATPVTGIRPSPINMTGEPTAGTVGTIVGFGTTALGANDYGIKRSGKVTTAACSSPVPDDTHLCWNFTNPVGPPGEDSNVCQLDAGGPLLVDLGGQATVAGITSGAFDCAPNALSSFDADVFFDREWIADAAGSDLGSAACGSMPQAGEGGTTISAFFGTLTRANPQALYQFEVPAGTESLRVVLNADPTSTPAEGDCGAPLSASSVDFDMYIRAGSPPGDQYDCAPLLVGGLELCEIRNLTPGTWYVLVNRFCGSAAYQVTATTFASADPCAAPRTDCRTAGKSQLALGGSKLNWKWGNGEATTQAEFADPTSSAEYALCIHDASGPAASMSIPASARWSAIGSKGYKYQDGTASADGIAKATLKGGGAGKAMALVKGQGSNLPDPALPLELPVIVQLVNLETGVCWESVFEESHVKKNDAGKFQAKR